jgi:hypothetical protein
MTYCRELTQKEKNDIVKKITNKNIKWKGNNLYFNDVYYYNSDNAQAIIDQIEYLHKNDLLIKKETVNEKIETVNEKIEKYLNEYKAYVKKVVLDFKGIVIDDDDKKLTEMVDKKRYKILDIIENSVDIGSLVKDRYKVKDIVVKNDQWYFQLDTRSKYNLYSFDEALS